MIKKIKGIVVKEIAYKDTSKIIEVLTNDGLYSIVAKGSKRVSSPLFLGTTFLSYSEFCIYVGDKISTLKSVSISILISKKKVQFSIYHKSYCILLTISVLPRSPLI